MKRRLHEVYEKKKISSYIERFSSLFGERNPGCFQDGQDFFQFSFYYVLGWRWYIGGAALYDERLWCCWWYYLLTGAGVFQVASRLMSLLKMKWWHCLRGGKWALSFLGWVRLGSCVFLYLRFPCMVRGGIYIGTTKDLMGTLLVYYRFKPTDGIGYQLDLHIGHTITLNCKTF